VQQYLEIFVSLISGALITLLGICLSRRIHKLEISGKDTSNHCKRSYKQELSIKILWIVLGIMVATQGVASAFNYPNIAYFIVMTGMGSMVICSIIFLISHLSNK
jgi:small-conductance mechanosensitive channel